MDDQKDNPVSSIPRRVGLLEVKVGVLEADIRWIKGLVGPTFLVSFVSLIILAVSFLRGMG